MRTEAEKILIKEIQSIKRNLQRSIERVKKYEKQYSTPSPARKKFKQLGKISVKGKNFEELTKLRRKLVYVKGLKTSKVKGFKHYVFIFRNITTDLSKEDLDKFWEIYNKAVEENRLWDHFKYELMIELYDGISAGESEEDIHERIEKLFQKLTEDEDVVSEGFYKDFYEMKNW